MAERTDVFRLKIISPDEVFFDGEATFLEFTSVEGEMGVYKNHIPLTTIIEPCVMRIHNGDDYKKCVVLGGFVEIQKANITVLAEEAQWPDDVDLARAEQAKKRAENRLAKADSKTDALRAQTALQRAIARINVVK